MRSVYHQIKNLIINVLFPPRCFGCNADTGTWLCAPCVADIPIHHAPFCPICHSRLPYGTKHCHPEAPYKLTAVTEYHHPAIKGLIHELKYRYLTSALIPIEAMIREYCAAVSLRTKNFLVVPVPLHNARFRERGFNQSALIARAVARGLQLEHHEHALTRTRDTKQQSASKTNEARVGNVAGCFAVTNPASVAGKNIVLVDDVYTSGATVNDAVRALRKAGAKQIIVFVLARAR